MFLLTCSQYIQFCYHLRTISIGTVIIDRYGLSDYRNVIAAVLACMYGDILNTCTHVGCVERCSHLCSRTQIERTAAEQRPLLVCE